MLRAHFLANQRKFSDLKLCMLFYMRVSCSRTSTPFLSIALPVDSESLDADQPCKQRLNVYERKMNSVWSSWLYFQNKCTGYSRFENLIAGTVLGISCFSSNHPNKSQYNTPSMPIHFPLKSLPIHYSSNYFRQSNQSEFQLSRKISTKIYHLVTYDKRNTNSTLLRMAQCTPTALCYIWHNIHQQHFVTYGTIYTNITLLHMTQYTPTTLCYI